MQSDQHVCFSLFGSIIAKPNYQNYKILASLCSRTGRCESYLAANIENRFCLIQFQPIKTPNTDLPILNGRFTALIPIRTGKFTI